VQQPAAPSGAETLLIWPEAVLPVSVDPRRPERLPGEVRMLLPPGRRDSLLMGAQGRPRDMRHAENGCLLLEPGGQMVWGHSKVRLVPYGEVVPFRGLVRFLQYPWGDYDLTEGRDLQPLLWHGRKLALLVCFDTLFPWETREQVKHGAGLIVVVTNNSWYKLHSGIRQHCDQDILRAVETRRTLARCSTTGWSQIIDPAGRVLAETNVESAGRLSRMVDTRKGLTPYALLGDWLGQLCVLAALLLVVPRLIAGRSESFL